MSEKNWFIISTQGVGSRGASQTQSLLDRMGYEGMLFIPTQKSTVVRYGKECPNNRPLFPSYIFIFTSLPDSKLEQALMEAKIGRFLHYAGDEQHPAKIPTEVMEYIKSLEEANVEPVPEEIIHVEIGNLVEVCVGPFMGIKGIITEVKGHDVYVETLVFGRSATVRFNVSHLSKLLDNYEEKTAE